MQLNFHCYVLQPRSEVGMELRLTSWLKSEHLSVCHVEHVYPVLQPVWHAGMQLCAS